jgi:uncharacterized protein
MFMITFSKPPQEQAQKSLSRNVTARNTLPAKSINDTPSQQCSVTENHRKVQSQTGSPISKIESGLYVGTIGHHRTRPVEHRFQYSIFMMMIDLDEVDKIFRYAPFCSQSRFSAIQFRRSDYFGDPSCPLKACINDFVMSELGMHVTGPIRLLTHPRYFGFACNPVSFYYCYAADGETLQAIVADVTNTPWGERHAYVIRCERVEDGKITFECEKQFHVSPFMPMNQKYRWRTSAPGNRLELEIDSLDSEGLIFQAALELIRSPFSYWRMAWLVARFPCMTIQVIITIYWQAFCLWRKRVPYIPHPKT